MTSVTPFPYGSSADLCCADYVFPLVTRLALEMMSPPARVLDAGCGNGGLAGALSAEGYDVTGVDLAQDGIDIARSTYPACRFELAGVGEDMLSGLGVEPFDILVSTEVIEHLYDPYSFVRGAYDAVRPGGAVILSTPYHGRLKNTLVAATGRFDAHVGVAHTGGHIKFFSRATLAELLRHHGLRDIRFYGAGRVPWIWKSMVMTAVKPP